MFKKLDREKKLGVISELAGFALLILTLVLIPLRTAGSWKYYLLPAAAALILIPIPAMWKDGLRQMKAKPPTASPWHRMRQSGFFDLLVLFAVIALVLFACWGFGRISYGAVLQKHAPGAATLAEAQQRADFIEYNFRQDLNLIAGSYPIFGSIALMITAAVLLCGLYMRFISPIVQADEQLQMAHGVYRIVAQYAAAILVVLISLFPIY